MKQYYYTHYVECFQASGAVKERYFNKCHIIDVMASGKIKIESISSKTGCILVRYVEPEKLIRIYESIKQE